MAIPVSFLLGLGVLLVADEWARPLPGSGTWTGALPWLLLLPLPYLVARLGGWALLRAATDLPSLLIPAKLLFGLKTLSVPLSFYALLIEGGLLDLAARSFGDSLLLRTSTLLVPLLVMEISMRRAEVRTQARLEGGEVVLLASPAFRTRIAMTLFLSAPVLLFAAVTDVVFQDRSFEVLFSGTSLGITLGMALLALLMCLLLPVLFRVLLFTTRHLPPHLAADLRATAAALRFPPRNLLAMHTGHRMVNAAMVGPLPWPRYLVLTDGLMAILDPLALRGVVAHEVGHARAGHPGLLLVVFGLLPLLLLQPILRLDLDQMDAFEVTAIALGAVLVLVLALKRIAHRFEFEADLLSAEALGGAEPCIRALRSVGRLSPQSVHRASLRHPSEQQRIQCLSSWQQDPAFRTRFRAAGRRLRIGIAVATVAVLAIAAWSWVDGWPVDRVVYQFYTGDFPGARQTLSEIGDDVRPSLRPWIDELRQELTAASELMPDGGPWEEIRGPLAEGGWRRGKDVFLAQGPAAALPWFGLTLSGTPSPLRESLYLYSRAARDGDVQMMAELRRHLATLGVPDQLARALQ